MFNEEKVFNWYVFAVEPGYGGALIKMLKSRFSKIINDVFVPHKEMFQIYTNASGKNYRVKKKPLFPGYVFVETELYASDFLEELDKGGYKCSKVIKLLRHGPNDYDIAVKEDTQLFLTLLWGKKKCIGTSSGYIDGKKIIINRGILRGQEGFVVEYDKEKMEVEISINFMGDRVSVTLALNLDNEAPTPQELNKQPAAV